MTDTVDRTNTADSTLLSELSEAARAQALDRFARLRPHLEDGVPLTQLAHQHGIPLRTARRWVRQYRRSGLVGLTHQSRSDRGQRRMEPQLQQLIAGLALQTPPPSAAFVHRQVTAVAREHGWALPSYDVVCRIIRGLDPGLRTLAHEGTKAYLEEFDLLYRRTAIRPNEIWQADHTLLDIWLLNDKGQPQRSWLTVILDDYSRAVAGYRLSFQAPSALQTALTLRGAIWRKAEAGWHVCGIPEVFYTDHGSDFTSRHLEQVSADIKMQLVFSFPGRPRGRGRIERFFGTVNQLFLCAQPGYAPAGNPSGPGSPAVRAKPVLTLVSLSERLGRFLIQDYQHRPHSETGVAPQTLWEDKGFLPQLPESLEQLDLLLLSVAKTRRVQQDGIRFQGLRYLDVNLGAYVGEDVTIRYDPQDMAEIRVYHENHFACRAVCQDLADQSISLKEIVAARTQRRKQVRSTLKAHNAVITELLPRELAEASAASAASLAAQLVPRSSGAPAAKAETVAEAVTEQGRPRLKRYINE